MLYWRASFAFTLVLLAFLLAYWQGFVSYLGAFLIILLGAMIYSYYHYFAFLSPFLKLLLGIFITILTFIFYVHWMPGFNNQLLISGMQISKGAYPFNLWFNFDKIFVGFFFLY